MPAERRSELLDQLEAIVLEEGFVGLTVDNFATRLRCSKSTLYRLAPSKEQLVGTIARHFFSRAARRIENVVSAAQTPPQKLRVYVTRVGAESSRGSPRFHEQMATHPSTAELYRRNSRVAAERVQSLIREGVDAGWFDVADVSFAGQCVAIVMDAIHLGGAMFPPPLDAVDASEKLADLILTGITGPHSASGSDSSSESQLRLRRAREAASDDCGERVRIA
jgi:AcrR family transcriptional regulator